MIEYTVVRKTRWYAWRDLAIVLLGFSVVLLVLQVRHLSDQLTATNLASIARSQAAAKDRAELQVKIDTFGQQAAAKDARIKQLTDLLIASRIPVPPVKATTAAAPTPLPSGPSPTPTASPTAPPAPKPTSTPSPSSSPRPSPTPTPSPSPSPTCLLRLGTRCLLP